MPWRCRRFTARLKHLLFIQTLAVSQVSLIPMLLLLLVLRLVTRMIAMKLLMLSLYIVFLRTLLVLLCSAATRGRPRETLSDI